MHRYRLFISHAWRYNSDYNKIIEFLNGAPYCIYSNYSVPKHDQLEAATTSQLKEELRQQIRPVEVVVILAGMYASYSDWIKFEIDYAKEIGKSILGVEPWGSQRIPSVVQTNADEMVGWNTSSIVSAIRRLAK